MIKRNRKEDSFLDSDGNNKEFTFSWIEGTDIFMPSSLEEIEHPAKPTSIQNAKWNNSNINITTASFIEYDNSKFFKYQSLEEFINYFFVGAFISYIFNETNKSIEKTRFSDKSLAYISIGEIQTFISLAIYIYGN
ncbi:hypothetical protein CDIK_3929 [Cucumispora dikerogammari]|nr:hypothetical protein CDIK_3929 [Cucumispora dikerogammari]